MEKKLLPTLDNIRKWISVQLQLIDSSDNSIEIFFFNPVAVYNEPESSDIEAQMLLSDRHHGSVSVINLLRMKGLHLRMWAFSWFPALLRPFLHLTLRFPKQQMKWKVKSYRLCIWELNSNTSKNKWVYLRLKSVQLSSIQNLYSDMVNLKRASSHKV